VTTSVATSVVTNVAVADARGAGAAGRLAGWVAEWRAAIVVALIAALAHVNAVVNGFTLDDDTVIGKNDLIRHLSSLWRAFAHPYWPEFTPAGQYRPLAIASFALDWAISGGSPHWYHLVNVLWHVAACVLVWRLLRDLVSPAGALLGALYFALQPVHVEAIANTVGRCDVMAAVFVVAALLAHRRGSWVAVPLYAAALASKESGAVFLGLAVANDLILRPAGSEHSADGERAAPGSWWRPRARLYAGYLGVAVLYVVALAIVFRHRPLVDIAPAWFRATLVERWLTEARVVPEYVRLMLVPLDLKIEYSPRVIEVAHGLSALVATGLVLTAVALVCLVAAWRRAPVAAFGLAWFGIAISPVSNILFASGVVLAERTLYLPSVGAALMVAWMVERSGFGVRGSGFEQRGQQSAVSGQQRHPAPVCATLRPTLEVGSRIPNPEARIPILIPLAAALVLCTFAVRSWTRTTVWHDDKRLVLNSLLSDPESYRTHLRAALILGYRKDWAGATREYAVARTLYPDDPYVFEAAAMIADAQDQFAAADRLYDSASIVMPGLADVYLKQARLRYRAGNFPGAIRSARAAYLAAPDSVAALDVLTGAAQHLDDFASAEWAFQRGLADHPGNASLHQQYAWMLAAKGDTSASRRQAALAARLGTPSPSSGAGRAPGATPTAASAPRGPAQGR
jgi:hypothetical protein